MSRLFAAHVQGGVIVAAGLDLPEGTQVTVVASDDGATDLSAAELVALDDAIADADRHEPVPFDDVLADFDRIQAAALR